MPQLFPTQGTFSLITQGLHPAICCEFIDLGTVDTRWGKKHKGAWVFQVDEREENGKRKEIRCSYNLAVGSVRKPSKVQKLMGKWRGQPYTQEELENGDVDPEKPIGQPCLLDIEHTEVEDGTTIHYVDMILPPGDMRLEPEDYVPVAERDPGGPSPASTGGQTTTGSEPPPAAAQTAPNAAYRDRPAF